ncbi:MAG: hypothetical protein ABSC37_16890 [Xanthobacteraceae bacterium]
MTSWLGLALIVCPLSVWLRASTALTEIIVGTAGQLIIGRQSRRSPDPRAVPARPFHD